MLADECVSPDAWGNADPSTIIDAGQWLTLSDRLLASDLASACDALRELEKFIALCATEPHRTAFFTPEGRALYVRQRARFQCDRLALAIAAYEDLLVRTGRVRS